MQDGSLRRGVIFISEIVPRLAISVVANVLYGEAYSTTRTRHEWTEASGSRRVRYEWQHRGEWQHLSVQSALAPQPIAKGSMEEFITEHYWGYNRRRGGGAGEYGVEHPRWQVYPVHEASIQADFGSLYSNAFAELTSRQPDHVLLAEGSPIAIRWGGRIS